MQIAEDRLTAPTARRKVPRAERFKRRRALSFGRSLGTPHNGLTTNLSASGLGLGANIAYAPGTMLYLEMLSSTGAKMQLQGIVAWARRGDARLGIKSYMGIRFVSVDERYFIDLAQMAEERAGRRPMAA